MNGSKVSFTVNKYKQYNLYLVVIPVIIKN